MTDSEVFNQEWLSSYPIVFYDAVSLGGEVQCKVCTFQGLVRILSNAPKMPFASEVAQSWLVRVFEMISAVFSHGCGGGYVASFHYVG